MARRGQDGGDEEEAARRLTARFTELSQAAFAVEADIKALVDCEHAVQFSRQSNVVRERLQVLQLEAQGAAAQIDTLDSADARRTLQDQRDGLEQHLRTLYASVRKATLGFKSKMEQHDSKQRALLLSGGAVALEHRKKLAQESLVKTATAVTESIRRTAQLLDAEVAKSTKTVEVLERSSQMLQQLKREYGRHEAAASTGRQVFSRLRQRELTDRILVALGMLVFALVVLYILKSRLLPSLSLTGWLWSTGA